MQAPWPVFSLIERQLERAASRVWDGRIWRYRPARLVAVPLFYLIATIIFTWPYATEFASSIPGWPMDNFNFLYKIWWVAHATFGNPPPGASLTFNPNIFYPSGYNLAQGELSPANTLLSIPVTATLGPVVSYNLLVLLSFVLSGWGMFLLVRYLLTVRPLLASAVADRLDDPPPAALNTRYSNLIALLCGLAFAFCPYRMEQMGGHLQMLGTQWLPFTFLYLERMLRERRWQHGALAGLFFALCCWEAWYYAAIIGLFVAIYIPIRWWQLRLTLSARFTIHNSQSIISFLAVTALLVAPFALPYIQLHGAGSLSYDAATANGNSAVPPDYFLPSMLHPLWGETFMQLHALGNPLENDLYLGLVPLVLFAFALTMRRRRIRQKALPSFSDFPFAAYLLVAGLGFVFSFGLSLHSGILLTNLGVPGAKASDSIWMPGWLLYKFVPLFNAVRAYARFALPTTMAVFVLAGLGLALLLTHPRFARYPYLIIATLTLLLLFDFAASPYAYGMSRVQSQPENDWLAAQSGNATVAFFPADFALRDGPATWYTLYHQKPIAYGYESFLPILYTMPQVSEPLLNFPSDARVWPLLKQWGVKYIMVSTTRWGDHWPQVQAALQSNANARYVAHFQEQNIWQGNANLWHYWPDFAWHAQPNDIMVYELVQ